jgi:hypothetical protein
MVHRLTEDYGGLLEGSCIADENFGKIYYLDRPLFEPIMELEIEDMIKYDDEVYCGENNIEYMLFYTEKELQNFLKKI